MIVRTERRVRDDTAYVITEKTKPVSKNTLRERAYAMVDETDGDEERRKKRRERRGKAWYEKKEPAPTGGRYSGRTYYGRRLLPPSIGGDL